MKFGTTPGGGSRAGRLAYREGSRIAASSIAVLLDIADKMLLNKLKNLLANPLARSQSLHCYKPQDLPYLNISK